jgi:hypothetical protein
MTAKLMHVLFLALAQSGPEVQMSGRFNLTRAGDIERRIG